MNINDLEIAKIASKVSIEKCIELSAGDELHYRALVCVNSMVLTINVIEKMVSNEFRPIVEDVMTADIAVVVETLAYNRFKGNKEADENIITAYKQRLVKEAEMVFNAGTEIDKLVG